jgi:hypothetical protein
MLASTTYMRVFVSAPAREPIISFLGILTEYAMQIVSGAHGSSDLRCAIPLPYLSWYPALYPQSMIRERALILGDDGEVASDIDAGHPPSFQNLVSRDNYDPDDLDDPGRDFGPTVSMLLGDVALARSGDKGGNVNIGLFVSRPALYHWFRLYMTRDRMQTLMGDDWREEYFIERVEFPRLLAVHFVIYGILGRGASATPNLDTLGKGFADWIRSRKCDVPRSLLR